MNNLNYKVNHMKKKSCVLFNKIPKGNYKKKDKFLEQSFNSIYNINSEKNVRLNTSINNKNEINNSKISFLTRPYIKQLSQYCFLTLKNKDSTNSSKLSEKKTLENMKSLEKDDKTNIYFNLIKTYYDENGMKLLPKQTEVYPKENDIDYPKIIKNKKKKTNNSLDEKGKENVLNYEKKNKTMNDNCNIYFAKLEREKNININNKFKITHKKIIKRKNFNNSININNKTPINKASSELPYKNSIKNKVTSPNISEKSFNIFFQNKSGDYIINDIYNNPIITGRVNTLNNENKLLTEINENNIIINRKKYNYDSIYSNGKEDKNENNVRELITYFNNKKRYNHRRIPTNKISDTNLVDVKSYDSMKKDIQAYRNSNTPIFKKKKISDSFDDAKRMKNHKKIENSKSYIITNYVDTLNIQKNTTHKIIFNSGGNFKHHNSALSWTNINFNKNNNNKNNKNNIINNNINKKISPKRLEKYFNPNQFKKNKIPFKTQYIKTPPDIEIIDINNITFKKPFKLIKNVKSDNNLVTEVNKAESEININLNKNKISSYYNNKMRIKKNAKILSQNISYNNDKGKDSSILNNKSKNNVTCRNTKNSPDSIHSYNIRYMKNKFKQNPYSFSNEKIKILHNINSFNERRKSDNESKDNINYKNQNKFIINSYNNKNYITSLDKNNQKEKIKKYLVQRNSRKNKNNSIFMINNNNNALKETNIEKQIIEGLINPTQKSGNISYQISITEPSIIYNQIKIKNSIQPENTHKNTNQKIIIEKEKRGNKKMYILKKKLKEGIIKLKTKYEVQNKLGMKKEIKNNQVII